MNAHQDNPTETRRQAIQAAIDATRSAAERNRLGQFATPNALAIDIARYVDSLIDDRKRGVRFADPSIGSGSFFSAALAVFGPKRIRSAVGVELDPAFCEAARDLWSDTALEVVHGDFTRVVANASRPPAPNLILANPPYVRHHHMDREDKERLQRLAYKMTGVEVNGLAGLYVYFLLLATAWMEDGGYAAWLIPSEFMDVNYGAALKRYLTDRVTLIRAHRFDPDDVQFGDALVSSVVLVFRKAPPPRGHEAEFTFGGTMNEPHASDRIPLERLRESRKWTVYPSHARNDRHTVSDGNGPTLSDFFRIQRGIATGSNKFFVLDRADAKRRELPGEVSPPDPAQPAASQDHRRSKATTTATRASTANCASSTATSRSMLSNSGTRPSGNTCKPPQALGIMDGYLVGKRSPWYKQEQRARSPFLCTYMGRGTDDKQPFRFILNRSKAIGTNLYLMLYPLNGLAAMLRKHPGRAADVHELLGRVSGHELRGEGRVYGGGLNKIEPSELGRISAAPFVERWPELRSSVQRQGELFGDQPAYDRMR